MSVESLRQRIADLLAAHDPKAMEPMEFPHHYLKKAKANQLAFGTAGARRAPARRPGRPPESGGVTVKSTQVRLAAYPVAEPQDSDFELVSTELPEVGEGQVLLRTIYLSLDPYMRGRMSTAKSYAAPLEIGDVVIGGTVCEVVESRAASRTVGDLVLASTAGRPMRSSTPATPGASTRPRPQSRRHSVCSACPASRRTPGCSSWAGRRPGGADLAAAARPRSLVLPAEVVIARFDAALPEIVTGP